MSRDEALQRARRSLDVSFDHFDKAKQGMDRYGMSAEAETFQIAYLKLFDRAERNLAAMANAVKMRDYAQADGHLVMFERVITEMSALAETTVEAVEAKRRDILRG